MKHVPALFAAAALGAVLTLNAPEPASAQNVVLLPQPSTDFEAFSRQGLNIRTEDLAACTADGQTVKALFVTTMWLPDIVRKIEGAPDEDKFNAAIGQFFIDSHYLESLQEAWDGAARELNSGDFTEIAVPDPSGQGVFMNYPEKTVTTIKQHLDQFRAAVTDATDVHLRMFYDRIGVFSPPEPGCTPQ